MNTPLFTQKHYEYLIANLRRRKLPRGAVAILCEIFAADNPKFKADKFKELTNTHPWSCGCEDCVAEADAILVGEYTEPAKHGL